MKFIHAADIHLDSPQRGLERYAGAPTALLREATRRAFRRLIELCVDEEADFLLLAGDLYDGDWQDYNTGLFFAEQMTRLREAGVPVFLIRGNHDAESKITRQLRLPDNVHLFSHTAPETHRLDDLGVAIHAQSFATQAVVENLSRAYPPSVSGCFNIGLLHTSCGCAGHDNYAPCSEADLAAKAYDYWALGHVHQRREIRTGEPWIVFPGNLQGRHVREAGAKGCAVVRVDHSGKAAHTHVSLDVVRWCHCVIFADGAPSVDDLLERARAALEEEARAAGDSLVAARITLRGACAAHRALVARPEAFVAELRAVAIEVGRVWIERVEIDTRAPVDLEALRGGCDPLGQLLQFTRDLRSDPVSLGSLAAEFADLRRKLQLSALGAGRVREILPEDPAALVAPLLGDIEQLLVPRLLEHDADLP